MLIVILISYCLGEKSETPASLDLESVPMKVDPFSGDMILAPQIKISRETLERRKSYLNIFLGCYYFNNSEYEKALKEFLLAEKAFPENWEIKVKIAKTIF